MCLSPDSSVLLVDLLVVLLEHLRVCDSEKVVPSPTREIDPDLPLEEVGHDVVHDGESEAGSPTAPRRRHEGIEDARNDLGGDPCPVVADVDPKAVFVRDDGSIPISARPRPRGVGMPQDVVHEVDDHLGQMARVPAPGRAALAEHHHREVDLGLLGLRPHRLHAVVGDRGELGAAEGIHQLAAGQLLEALDQQVCALDVA